MTDISIIQDWTRITGKTPDEIRIERESNRILGEQMLVSGKTGLVCVLAYALMILMLRADVTVLIWCVAMALLYAGRHYRLSEHVRNNPGWAEDSGTIGKLEVSVLATGAGWGIGIALFTWTDLPLTRLPFLLVAMGMLTICGPLMSARPRFGIVFTIPLLLGTLIHLYRMDLGHVYFITTTIILCAITAFALVLTYEIHRILRNGIIQRLEKESLVEDLTKARQRAEDIARSKSAFLASMSHEIRNPVNGLMGMLDILRETHPTREQEGYLDVASNSAQSLLALLNKILDFSKLEVGKLELESIPFDWMSLTGETAMVNRVLASEKGIAFHLSFSDTAPAIVRGDPLRLRQILTNLLSNALKFTDEGSITLSVNAEDCPDGRLKLTFSVKDTGIGMDEATRSKLFEKYRQADASTSRRFGGTGLGLAISRELAHLMDGELSVQSTPGHGSEFILTACFVRSSAEELSASGGEAGEKRYEARVLLVEDDAVSQRVATMMLRRFGIDPVVAASGREAVRLFSESRFDLVLLDSRLPDMDGDAVAKALCAQSAARGASAKDCPVVSLSGACLPEDRQRALAAGVKDFLDKPLRKKDLRQCLEKWLGAK
jgi:signal transduction histidine kinase/ActR/RegA family two-component response regulator